MPSQVKREEILYIGIKIEKLVLHNKHKTDRKRGDWLGNLTRMNVGSLYSMYSRSYEQGICNWVMSHFQVHCHGSIAWSLCFLVLLFVSCQLKRMKVYEICWHEIEAQILAFSLAHQSRSSMLIKLFNVSSGKHDFAAFYIVFRVSFSWPKLLSSCLLCLFDFEERTRKSWVDAEMTSLDLETLMREHLWFLNKSGIQHLPANGRSEWEWCPLGNHSLWSLVWVTLNAIRLLFNFKIKPFLSHSQCGTSTTQAEIYCPHAFLLLLLSLVIPSTPLHSFNF